MGANLTSAHALYYPDLASFRSFVDDALRLADRALDAADSHIDRNADVGLDAVLQPCRAGSASLYQDGQMVERPLPGNLERVMRAEPRLLEDQLLDLRREQVDAADNQHVVGASGDFLHAAHGAGGAGQQARQVPGAIADDGQRFLGERGEYQLAFLAVGKRLAARRVHHLGIEVVFPDSEAVLRLDALLRHARSDHLGQAVEVDRLERKPSLYI